MIPKPDLSRAQQGVRALQSIPNWYLCDQSEGKADWQVSKDYKRTAIFLFNFLHLWEWETQKYCFDNDRSEKETNCLAFYKRIVKKKNGKLNFFFFTYYEVIALCPLGIHEMQVFEDHLYRYYHEDL